MVWDELDCRVKKNQPTSAQHMWELFQDFWKSIPGEAGLENPKSVKNCQRQRVAILKNLKYKIYFDLFDTLVHYVIPYVLFHSFDVFTYSTM